MKTALTERAAAALNGSRAARVAEGLRHRAVPTHWSSMFAEVALYSLVIVFVTGIFLTFFYDPSTTMVEYDGAYVPLQGIEMSRALDSTLHVTFDVRGGLLIRQAHHWASLLLLAALGAHLLSMFFTGAFRRPRRLNWVVAFFVFVLSLVAGWTGYALPDDMLSGSGLRIVHGVILGIPVVGTWLSFLVFGGEFPSTIIATFYPAHAIVVPLLILALVVLYIARIVSQRPPQFAGPGRTDDNVVGVPVLPKYALKTGGLFFLVFALVMLISATVTINPVWNYGPSSPGDATAGSQPDWYMGFLDGALRLVPPGWEVVVFGHTLTLAVLAPLTAIGVFMLLVLVYPFAEEWITGDKREHHILDRPRNAPVRTAIGVAGVVFYVALWGAASADVAASHFRLSIEGIIHFYQALLVVGPLVGFIVTRQVALALQRKDRELVLHGVETGRIVRLQGGEYIEMHKPVGEYERWRLVDFEEQAPLKMRPDARGRVSRSQRLRVRLSRLFFEDRVAPVTRGELDGPH
ncbi:cytochrome bc complex cytochrome b subunit [Conyzicola nivalis]|uniref:Cytochrome bc1 complex cytochrome b subunit n=1 Tax=Conyzicola nivalis TaxID=1477021 RepID=A0A916WFW8_9MICO|nr:cytochrome b N-terminal domain-containing protein [Conyzicola nivalis]GGA93559.1 menaquinol-cytochrome c reductase cytochrome b subunit [Conyzicola nivalis]